MTVLKPATQIQIRWNAAAAERNIERRLVTVIPVIAQIQPRNHALVMVSGTPAIAASHAVGGRYAYNPAESALRNATVIII